MGKIMKSLEKCIDGARVFDICGNEYIEIGEEPNYNCDCYTCQCDGGCDCVCQQSCDAGPCYGGTA